MVLVVRDVAPGEPSLPLIRILVPGTTGRFRCGGLQVELQTAELLKRLTSVEVVTYRQREPDFPCLADLLSQEPAPGNHLWIVSWGFDVPRLLRRLQGRRVAYHAHSSGYGFDLPAGVPVLAVSRNTLAYWGARSPRNPLYLVPNALEPRWLERGCRSRMLPAGPPAQRRPIDVLIQQRKSSAYVLDALVPALRARGLKVEVQAGWVEDLVDLFNSATVYLYDTADYWRGRGVSEGFGLPPIEALACGCVVFSSFNHALADLMEPGVVGHQLGCASLSNDVSRIEAAVQDPSAWSVSAEHLVSLLEQLSEPALLNSWERALCQISRISILPGESPLHTRQLWRIQLDQWRQRLQRSRAGR